MSFYIIPFVMEGLDLLMQLFSPSLLLKVHAATSIGLLAPNPSNAEATFFPKHNIAKICQKHLNPIVLVFIG